MTAGEKIRKRRYEISVTRQELAKQLGHGSNYIANVELGYRILGERELEIVADYLKCNASELKSTLIDPTNDDFGVVCNCAVRYCLGRRSYMPSLICGYITPLLPELTDKTLDCFERDIAERKQKGFDFGDSCDYETWDAFYKAVCKEIERRKDDGNQTD